MGNPSRREKEVFVGSYVYIAQDGQRLRGLYKTSIRTEAKKPYS